jgi:hypothetical protein
MADTHFAALPLKKKKKKNLKYVLSNPKIITRFRSRPFDLWNVLKTTLSFNNSSSIRASSVSWKKHGMLL